MARPKIKYILFLVEGFTDISVLSAGIADLYEKYTKPGEYVIKFCSMQQGDQLGGDITSSHGVTPDNIEQLISKLFIDPFLAKNPYIYPKEIFEIVQIVDLDGVFLEDDNVIPILESDPRGRVYYGTDGIYAVDVESIRERNRRKRDNIQKLISMDKIVIRPNNHRNTKTIRYSVYYFSCNMDHYLHGDANLSSQKKVEMADDFMLECYDDTARFCKRLCFESDSVAGRSFAESWKYITERGLNSLERHSNINLLIDSIQNQKV